MNKPTYVKCPQGGTRVLKRPYNGWLLCPTCGEKALVANGRLSRHLAPATDAFIARRPKGPVRRPVSRA